jgi:hypothetical protein
MMPIPHAETVGSLLHSEALIAARVEDPQSGGRPISAAVRIAVHAPVFIAFPG